MGSSLCGHLLDAGYQVTIHSRTRERAEPLLDRGAVWANSSAMVAAVSEVVFTMVGFPIDGSEVVLGDEGVLSALQPGGAIVDTTTSEPGLAKTIYAAARANEIVSLDAPGLVAMSTRVTRRWRSWSAETRMPSNACCRSSR